MSLKTEKRFCIIGAGGFARETLVYLLDKMQAEGIPADGNIVFLEPLETKVAEKINGFPVLKINPLNFNDYYFIAAIGNPEIRKKVINDLPKSINFFSIIHPSVKLNAGVQIGNGSIVAPGCYLTCDIEIGKHSHLNLKTTIGHDCKAGHYFTTAPATNISGNCTIGNQVYLGTNSCIRQKIKICDDVIIGMGSVVIEDILESGTYAGNPCKRIHTK